MAVFNIGDEVEVIATGETGTVEAVTKNFFRQTRIKLVGGKSTYKESELRRVTTTTSSTTDDYTSDDTPDIVTQVVLANIYLDQMDDITQNVTELNNTIPYPEIKPDVVQTEAPSTAVEEVKSSFYTERVDSWEAPVSTESKSVDVDTSSSRSVSVEDSTSSWRSSSSDDNSSSWSSSSSDDNSSSRWSSSSDDSSSSWSSSSSDSSSYDSSSSSSSSSDW